MRIDGIPFSELDCCGTGTTLVSEATPEPRDRANRIPTCLELNTQGTFLKHSERQALLFFLDDLEIAGRVEKGIKNETWVLALAPAERAMLLSVLDDPPESLLE